MSLNDCSFLISRVICKGKALHNCAHLRKSNSILTCKLPQGIDDKVLVEIFLDGGSEFTTIVVDVGCGSDSHPVALLPTEVYSRQKFYWFSYRIWLQTRISSHSTNCCQDSTYNHCHHAFDLILGGTSIPRKY